MAVLISLCIISISVVILIIALYRMRKNLHERINFIRDTSLPNLQVQIDYIKSYTELQENIKYRKVIFRPVLEDLPEKVDLLLKELGYEFVIEEHERKAALVKKGKRAKC